MSNTPFHENVCIITGASSGIGREVAVQLAQQGAWLVLAARNERRLEAVAEACRQLGGQAIVVPTDVSDEGQCRRLIEKAVSEYGRIDTLINNAGISMVARFEEVENLSAMRKIMEINYYGSVYCTHYALPHLIETGGRIVGVASLTGKTGVPTRTFYAASKHAMAGFFDSLRIELSEKRVSVTMVYPGFVATEVRKRALGTDGQSIGKSYIDEADIMSAEACAEKIIAAAGHRRRELVMTLKGKIGMWVKLVAPGLMDKVAKRTAESGK